MSFLYINKMLPLIQNSARTLVDIMRDKAEAGSSFDINRVYGSFTMETILATAFGRIIEVQRGESDALVSAAYILFEFVRKNRRLFTCVLSKSSELRYKLLSSGHLTLQVAFRGWILCWPV